MRPTLLTLPFLMLLNPVVPATLVGLGWSVHAVAGTISARSLVGVWKVQLDSKQQAAAIAAQIAMRATEYSDAEITKLGLDVAEIRKLNRLAYADEDVGESLVMTALLPELKITFQQGVVTWYFGEREYSKDTYKVKSVAGKVVTTAETPTRAAPGGGVWAPTKSVYTFSNETEFTMKAADGRMLAFNRVSTSSTHRQRPPSLREKTTQLSRVDINKASAPEIDGLPGIGPTRAAAIVDDRVKNGPFRSCNDLQRVYGIGPKTIENFRDRCTVSSP